MNSFDSQRQDSLKRRWLEMRIVSSTPTSSGADVGNPKNNPQGSFLGLDDDLVSNVVPPVTIVLEGRSICHRISLHKHASYHSLAKALRQMFVDGADAGLTSENELDLSNAIPGHLIAYEDIENDLLLAGDLSWKDFVRVAKRIRILPVKSNSRKGI
ncbi:auxin-responsive protein IAA33-like [Juglans microcarpa x Juglans regia]|uniref:Auxin-responsive protein n=2 Tax=Juglans regia TaxID=51240 RepID=A0A2I4EN63_JUGRE|nr:auxin-responsive protein IAA33 [Juglans regia]XP_041021929.1 auxin-responsive protein IAA33-like [Juglans microcarpa x Juglans regia]KAF5461754.1 hypothetical protein F2P56_017827 [Juglans regia]